MLQEDISRSMPEEETGSRRWSVWQVEKFFKWIIKYLYGGTGITYLRPLAQIHSDQFWQAREQQYRISVSHLKYSLSRDTNFFLARLSFLVNMRICMIMIYIQYNTYNTSQRDLNLYKQKLWIKIKRLINTHKISVLNVASRWNGTTDSSDSLI